MSSIVTLKLTPSEVEILDWLQEYRKAESRSAVIRESFMAQAFVHQAPEKLQKAAHRERRAVPAPLCPPKVPEAVEPIAKDGSTKERKTRGRTGSKKKVARKKARKGE